MAVDERWNPAITLSVWACRLVWSDLIDMIIRPHYSDCNRKFSKVSWRVGDAEADVITVLR